MVGKIVFGVGMIFGFTYGLLFIFWGWSKVFDPKGEKIVFSRIPAEVMIAGLVVCFLGAVVWFLIGRIVRSERTKREVQMGILNGDLNKI